MSLVSPPFVVTHPGSSQLTVNKAAIAAHVSSKIRGWPKALKHQGPKTPLNTGWPVAGGARGRFSVVILELDCPIRGHGL